MSNISLFKVHKLKDLILIGLILILISYIFENLLVEIAIWKKNNYTINHQMTIICQR